MSKRIKEAEKVSCIQFRVSDITEKRINTLARKKGYNKSDVIRFAIEAYLEAHDVKGW